MSANNAAFSSDDKLVKSLTVTFAFGFWICNCSSFVNVLTRLSPLIVSVDRSSSVSSGNVNVAVPFFEIVTIVPVGKLLATLIAASIFSFSSRVNSSKLPTAIFPGIFTVVFSGTSTNFRRFISILKKFGWNFCVILFPKTLLQALSLFILISDHNLASCLFAFPVTKI